MGLIHLEERNELLLLDATRVSDAIFVELLLQTTHERSRSHINQMVSLSKCDIIINDMLLFL